MPDYIDEYIREQRSRDRTLGYTQAGQRREAATVRGAIETRQRPGIDPGFTPPDRGAQFGRERGEPLGREDVTGTVIAGRSGRSDLAPFQRPRRLFGTTATETEMRTSGYDPVAIRQARQASHAPFHAGTIDGRDVHIVGPNKIRIANAEGGGYSEFVTSHQGKPILASQYLDMHGGFRPNEQYSSLRGRAAGITPPAAIPGGIHEVAPGVGPTVTRGGVEVPVGQLSPEERGRLQHTGETFSPSGAIAASRILGGRISEAARGVADFGRRAFGGFGGGTFAGTPAPTGPAGAGAAPPAGASRNQAARIEQPTAASPVPRTETTPPNINTGKLSTTPTPGTAGVSQGQTRLPTTFNPQGYPRAIPTGGSVGDTRMPLPQDWTNRRMQFTGF